MLKLLKLTKKFKLTKKKNKIIMLNHQDYNIK